MSVSHKCRGVMTGGSPELGVAIQAQGKIELAGNENDVAGIQGERTVPKGRYDWPQPICGSRL